MSAPVKDAGGGQAGQDDSPRGSGKAVSVKKWIIPVIALLLLSLCFQVFIWLSVRELREAAPAPSNRDLLESLQTEMAEMNQTINSIAREQRWLQECVFLLDKDNSRQENMAVNVNVTLSRLGEKETIFILFRPKGDAEWAEEELRLVQGLEYSTRILLSPFYEYEYMVASRGGMEISSDTALIPYNVYGLPRWSTDLKVTFASGSNAVDFTIFVLVSQNVPLPEMRPVKVELRAESAGAVSESIGFAEDHNAAGTWSTAWSLPDAAVVNDISVFIDVTYENGLTRSEPFEMLKDRVRYEMK
ncbi:MAG: hypothetical protein LBQ16_07015 [Gracilibacteraceae bacterium]|jgi:hypothetical protein|nr:hypothetical protein [Gracilibacteraceae bacterium]